jgi:hypothetical protein
MGRLYTIIKASNSIYFVSNDSKNKFRLFNAKEGSHFYIGDCSLKKDSYNRVIKKLEFKGIQLELPVTAYIYSLEGCFIEQDLSVISIRFISDKKSNILKAASNLDVKLTSIKELADVVNRTQPYKNIYKKDA